MRVGLYDGEMTGGIDYDDHAVSWRMFAHAVYSEADVLAIELTQDVGSSARINVGNWKFVPSSFNRLAWQAACRGLPANPPPLDPITAADGAVVVVQKHLRGTEHATAYLTVGAGSSGTSVTYISTSDVLQSGESGAVALAAVRAARMVGITVLTASHRKWWHAYYARSFFTLASPMIESFYWIQMYGKVAIREHRDSIQKPHLVASFYKLIYFGMLLVSLERTNMQCLLWGHPPTHPPTTTVTK